MRAFALSVAGALTVVLAAGAAKADETPDPVRAASLFAEGRRLMAAEEYAAACPKLAESQALDPAPDTALDLGICYEKASQAAFKVAHALAHDPVGGGAPSASSRGFAPDAEVQAKGQTQRIVGLTIGGAGVVGLIVGAITGVMAKSAYDNVASGCAGSVCPASAFSQIRSSRDLAVASTFSLLAGAGALAGGAVVFFTSPKASLGAGGASVGLGPAAEGAGLSVAGRF